MFATDMGFSWRSQGTPKVYFDVQLGRGRDATKLGRIVMELRSDVTPKTAENFKQLCMSPEGEGYRGSRFHRVIPSFMCQGGASVVEGSSASRRDADACFFNYFSRRDAVVR